jgi:hypothetical protein
LEHVPFGVLNVRSRVIGVSCKWQATQFFQSVPEYQQVIEKIVQATILLERLNWGNAYRLCDVFVK